MVEVVATEADMAEVVAIEATEESQKRRFYLKAFC